jgi:hypothetical protein
MALKTLIWREGLTVPHDVQGIDVYRWLLADWLDGETVATAEVLPVTGLTAVAGTVGPGMDYVDVQISAGLAPAQVPVTVRAGSSGGRRLDRTVIFDLREM